jgi:cysteinyl-tRNA synthetase
LICFSGPTVYDSAHIGHASTYVRLDILQRILRSRFGVNLITSMNITNIDDKIIKKSNETGRSWKVIADEYEAEFWKDLDSLNVKHPDIKLRVTDEIPKIIKFIEGIEQRGLTEKANDGSIYFKTSDYANYGKLQNVVVEDSSSAANFALWKGVKPGEPSWDTKWGPGRPGWHIECSTLASLVFGSHLDFHAGGIDLKFPHHENEEAQSCVFHSVDDWVTNWIHTGHLHLKGQSEKMSKSLKNTVTIRELLQEHSSEQFRVACLLSHYRSSIEFGPELMTAADSILKKVQSFRDDARAFVMGLKGVAAIDEQVLTSALRKCKEEVDGALCDDFNTAKSIGCILELMSVTSKMINNIQGNHHSSDSNEKALVQGIVNYIIETFKVFGIDRREKTSESTNNLQIENLVNSIIRVRNEIRLKAKEEKNKELFKVCDAIRDSLKENEIEIKDHGNLSSWNKN